MDAQGLVKSDGKGTGAFFPVGRDNPYLTEPPNRPAQSGQTSGVDAVVIRQKDQ